MDRTGKSVNSSAPTVADIERLKEINKNLTDNLKLSESIVRHQNNQIEQRDKTIELLGSTLEDIFKVLCKIAPGIVKEHLETEFKVLGDYLYYKAVEGM